MSATDVELYRVAHRCGVLEAALIGLLGIVERNATVPLGATDQYLVDRPRELLAQRADSATR